jgi:hypothetical protein
MFKIPSMQFFNMGFVALDREKRGFARYCPTFKAAWDRMKDRLEEASRRRESKRALRRLLDKGEVTLAASSLTGSPERIRYLGRLLLGRDQQIATLSSWTLRKAAESGTDISPARAHLYSALWSADYFYVRISAAMALGDMAAVCAPEVRSETMERLRVYIREGLPHSVKLEPGAAPMYVKSLLDVLFAIRAADGVYPIEMASLSRLLKDLDPPAADYASGIE